MQLFFLIISASKIYCREIRRNPPFSTITKNCQSLLFSQVGISTTAKKVEQASKNLKGRFLYDTDCLKKAEELVKSSESGRFIYAAARQNMNRLMTWK